MISIECLTVYTLVCFIDSFIMRQLKGKTKETAREKRQRKKEFLTNKDKMLSVALPAFAGFWIFVIVFIYFSVKPKTDASNL